MNPQCNSTGLIAGVSGYGGVNASSIDEGANGLGHVQTLPNVRPFSKCVLTRGSIIPGKIARMLDTEWATLTEPHQRLKWARLRAKFSTQKAGADALQMEEGTYSQYERAPGTSRWATLNHQLAIAAGRKYKVSWTWLLVGEGTPFDKPSSPAQERVLSAMASADPADQERVAEAVELLLKRSA